MRSWWIGTFDDLSSFASPGKALCLGARRGEEVKALQSRGWDAEGIDLVPWPPLVKEGDFQLLDYPDAVFDLVYTNSMDHAMDPFGMVLAAKRVLKPGGVFYVHIPILASDAWSSVEFEKPEDVTWLLRDFLILLSEPVPNNSDFNHRVIARKQC